MTAANERVSDPPAVAAPASARSCSSSRATVARYDKSLADFRARLVAAGKEKMVIRIALARKLLVRLNAKARDARAQYANAT